MMFNRQKPRQYWLQLKINTYALYLASKDDRVSLLAKIIIVSVVAYALSPIDLIPDFIPILGYLDDLLLIPFGIWLAVRLIPKSVWNECRVLAEKQFHKLKPVYWVVGVIIAIWVLIPAVLIAWAWRFWSG